MSLISEALDGVTVRRLKLAHARNPARRQACQYNLELFKQTYMPRLFNAPCRYHVESTTRQQTVTLLKDPIVYMDAEAAPRSIGKTTQCRGWVLWVTLYNHLDYSLFLCVNDEKAIDNVKAIKAELITNETLAEDFPEFGGWARSFGGDARKCKMMYPSNEWTDNELNFPSGAWICARGMDSALPGMNKKGKRPKLIIFDDAEDLKIATSTTLRQQLEDRTYLEALKLHDAHHRAIYWWVCTIYARGCVADSITDPKERPEWRGKRYKAIETWPARRDMVEKFVELYKRGQVDAEIENRPTLAEPGETAAALKYSAAGFAELAPGYQLALRYYVGNRTEIERESVVLDAIHLPLHRCLEEYAKDRRSMLFQLQNEPPEDEGTTRIQLDVEYLLTRRIGEARGVVPEWGRYLTAAVDIGAYVMHWQIDAWDAALRTSCLIQQGTEETNLSAGGEYKMTDNQETKKVMVATAIRETLERLRLKFVEGFPTTQGNRLHVALHGVDCGGTAETFAWYETVLKFCRSAPRWIALKGEKWAERTADRAGGKNWIVEETNNPFFRHDANADVYKQKVARALEAPTRTPDGQIYPGTRILHRETPVVYCRHLTAEYWIEEVAKEDVRSGKDVQIGWNKRSGIPNHWWDTSWMSFALADVLSFLRRRPPVRIQTRQQSQEKPRDPSLG